MKDCDAIDILKSTQKKGTFEKQRFYFKEKKMVDPTVYRKGGYSSHSFIEILVFIIPTFG